MTVGGGAGHGMSWHSTRKVQPSGMLARRVSAELQLRRANLQPSQAPTQSPSPPLWRICDDQLSLGDLDAKTWCPPQYHGRLATLLQAEKARHPKAHRLKSIGEDINEKGFREAEYKKLQWDNRNGRE